MNKDLVLAIIKRVVVLSLIIIVAIGLGFKDPKPIILGFIFGTIISVLGFKLLHNTIERSVTMAPGRASGYSTAHYFLRYTIYGIVLSVAALADYLSFLGTFGGLMMIKFVILMSAIFDKRFQR